MNLPQRLHRNNPNVLSWEDAFLKEGGNPIFGYFGSWNSACFVSQAVFDCQMYPNFGKIWCNVGNMIQYPVYHSGIIQLASLLPCESVYPSTLHQDFAKSPSTSKHVAPGGSEKIPTIKTWNFNVTFAHASKHFDKSWVNFVYFVESFV